MVLSPASVHRLLPLNVKELCVTNLLPLYYIIIRIYFKRETQQIKKKSCKIHLHSPLQIAVDTLEQLYHMPNPL